jgi:Zn-finger nucleic acid-binding protein
MYKSLTQRYVKKERYIMPRSKDEWIDANEAATILAKSGGHPISSDYVRTLAYKGKIRYRSKDGRTNEYYRLDIENYKVRKNNRQQRSRRAKNSEDFRIPA